MSVTSTSTERLHGVPRTANRPPQRRLGAGPQLGDAAGAALQVADVLVWALPEPWGPVGAAALTLVQLFFGDQDAPSPFTAVVQQLEQYEEQQEIATFARNIKGFAAWMVQQHQTLSITQGNNTTYINNTVLVKLRAMTGPGHDSVYDAVAGLQDHLSTAGVFDLWVLGGSVLLLGLKMIVQLDALLASTADKAGDDANFATYTQQWLDDYANFLTATVGGGGVVGQAQQVSQYISDQESQRLAQITEPYRYTEQHWQFDPNGGDGYYYTNGWTYRDAALGDTDTTNYVDDTFTGGNCCSQGTTVEHQDTVQQAHDSHVSAVVAQLDATYGNATATVKQWQSAIDQWNQHLPPQPPTKAPKVGTATGVSKPLPQPGGWVSGTKVRYAVAFANDHGPSIPGPWSDPFTIDDQAYLELSELPTDPLQMAVTRQIHRRIGPGDPNSDVYSIVGVGQMTDATYDDTSP
ncbi:hypothetical protein [Virgisporangium aliadipatigenens]|uniref:hypothetical protein n=1 Tax=Virgisporangium aliadipatigenens TaxID=741659 RepID=UPI001942E5B3|nr:hypothetical protein [Virgisporangium aliadipatigenens]